MPLTQGQHLHDRYWVANLVEQGGFGAVYKAWDITLDRPVAIKESYEESVEGQRQFLREAQILAKLSHPNLPRVTDFFTIPEQGQYLVMDFVEGQSLEELRLLAGERLPQAQALGWIDQVLDALSYIHSQDPPVIHRDIKPFNIKVTPPDAGHPQGRAMLVDFGVAKTYESHKRTTMGARAVTPGYSPIEQYGTGTTDARTDIYALGATLYTLLTGQEPPEAPKRVVRDPLVRPKQLTPDLSPEIEAVILRAMCADPDERFQTTNEFKAAIRGLLAVEAAQPPVAGSQQAADSRQPPLASSSLPAVVVEPPAQPLVKEVKLPTPQPLAQPAAPASPTGGAPRPAGQTPATGRGVPAAVGAPGGAPSSPPVAGRAAQPASRRFPWKWLGLVTGLVVELVIVVVLAVLIIQGIRGGQTTETDITQSSMVDGMVQVYIPGGTFQMGSENGTGDEQPVHTVMLDAFWMDQTEVTNAMYARCEVDGACSQPQDTRSYTRDSYYENAVFADYPVINVDWNQAAAYCQWAGRALPTEAQWEYAARGGLEGGTYTWGDENPSCMLGAQNGAQFYDCSPNDTIRVASFAPNGYGLYDMAGNVWEWVADWYGPYSRLAVDNPSGPASGDTRVLRGGSWSGNGSSLRVSSRRGNAPDFTLYLIGFRCAFSP